MEEILEFLTNFKEDHNFIFNIIMIIIILSILGIFISVPIMASGFIGTLGAILLDLCALPTIIKLVKLWTK